MNGGAMLVGLLGWPLGHSVSPAMQNAAFAAAKLDWHYAPLPVPPDRLAAAVRGLTAGDYRGANVTVPHKETVLAYVDELGPEVRAIGATNTLVRRGDRLVARNTDAEGFSGVLARAGCLPRRAVVLGAGGAARAVVYSLISLGAGVTVASRDPARANALAAAPMASPGRVSAASLDFESLGPRLAEADLLVNATPVGMWPRPGDSPLPAGCRMGPHLTVMDLVYNPLETMLLKQAREAGARTLDGLGMLVLQGAAAFRLWTGCEAPVAVMQAAAAAALVKLGQGCAVSREGPSEPDSQ